VLSSVYCTIIPPRLAVLGISCLLPPELCNAHCISKAVPDRPLSTDRPYCKPVGTDRPYFKPVNSSGLHLSNTLFTLVCVDQWRTMEFCSGGRGRSTNSVEDRGHGSGGGSPIVRGSGGSCNFVQEIPFHIVKSS